MQLNGRRRRITAFAALALFGLGACADEDRMDPASPRSATDVELSVQVSKLTAATGETVTVAVAARPTMDVVVGALQGELRYDASQLEFVGQIIDQPGAMVVINDSRADAGSIRLASLHPTGLTERVAVFAFEVRGSNYAANLRFEPELVGTVGSEPLRSRFNRGATANADLPASDDARRMTYIDWAIVADPTLEPIDGNLSWITGLPPEGALYGDVTLDGVINTFDGADVANVSVGNREVIIGTNAGSGVDRVTVANVRPSNLANSCLPGFENIAACTGRSINVFDAQPILREAVGIAEDVVGDVVALPRSSWEVGDTTVLAAQTVTGQLVLTADRLWVLDGVILIGDEGGAAGELVVEPGTTIQGDSLSAIYVTRNGRLIADGTATQPITFTCLNDQRGAGSGRFAQCWGGVFIAGNAVLNEQQASLAQTAPVIPGRNPVGGQNQREGEGGAVNYGGGNDTDSSGVIRYARFMYGGRNVTPNNELNNLTIGACGSGTILEYIQVHGGSDDGLEFFGGRCNAKYVYATANDDDQVDYSFGYDGSIQFVVIQMTSVGGISGGDKGHEVDNTETSTTYNNLPRVASQVYNVTYVGQTPDAVKTREAMHYRRGAGGTLRNFVIVGANRGFLIDNAETCTLTADNIVFIDVVTQLAGSAACSPSILGSNVASQTAGQQLMDPYDVQLPDFRPAGNGIVAAFSPAVPPSDGFFDTSALYFGGVAPASLSGNVVPWYAGWTVGWQNAVTP